MKSFADMIQINDQGKEFVKQVVESLHKMTRAEQKITSEDHPQSNGLDSLITDLGVQENMNR